MTQRRKKLLVQVRDAIRLKRYASSTEQTYVHWIKRYILFHGKCHTHEEHRPRRPVPAEYDSNIRSEQLPPAYL